MHRRCTLHAASLLADIMGNGVVAAVAEQGKDKDGMAGSSGVVAVSWRAAVS